MLSSSSSVFTFIFTLADNGFRRRKADRSHVREVALVRRGAAVLPGLLPRSLAGRGGVRRKGF